MIPDPAVPSLKQDAFLNEKPRILVVDDEMSNRLLLNRFLSAHSYIVEAENGQEALDWLMRESFDVVLLDIMMPVMTGLEALQNIRQTPKIADLPVILISALSQSQDIVRGLDMGASDYISKPFDLDVVLARVDTHCKMKRMMDVYKQSIVELEAAQQMKDRLFRIASHDLKSPLSTVTIAEVLLRQLMGDDPTVLDVLDTLRMTVRNMNQVIEEFLDMAACQSSSIDIQMQRVEVQQVMMEVVTQYTIPASQKHIRLEVNDLPGDVQADQARLAQVLSNLVSNAVKYSPEHTTVTLWSEIFDDRVRIHVADQGPGIPEDERDYLFKEFSKLSTRPTGGESSTGLGLWIVSHMVTLQGGTVGIDCPAEGGSIFWVEFPAFTR